MIFYGDIYPIKRRKRGTNEWETVAWWGETRWCAYRWFLCDRIADEQWTHARLLPNFDVVQIFLEEYLIWNPEEFDAYCWVEED